MSTRDVRFPRQPDPDERPPVRLTITAYAVLFTAFLGLLVLRLSRFIDWSWWWITVPLWAGPVGQLAWILRERFQSRQFDSSRSIR